MSECKIPHMVILRILLKKIGGEMSKESSSENIQKKIPGKQGLGPGEEKKLKVERNCGWDHVEHTHTHTAFACNLH